MVMNIDRLNYEYYAFLFFLIIRVGDTTFENLLV
jgi:hypothetical protein